MRARQQSGSKTPAPTSTTASPASSQQKVSEAKPGVGSLSSPSPGLLPSSPVVAGGQQKVFHLVSPGPGQQQQLRMAQPGVMSQMLSQLQPHPPQPQQLQRQFSQQGHFQ